ncbi:MAG: YkgJ family cysteine cluster protein [Candidatus Brocadiae bacterium]|nr:YkgJ family cysteine cluster protein [Candidatus Brocadiia bacterium]
MDRTLSRYRALLDEIDVWFRSVQARHGAEMKCGSGCFDCCHGAFDVGPLDAALVREAVRALPDAVRAEVEATARRHVEVLGLTPPYAVDPLDEEGVDALAAKLGPVPCPLLDSGGRCRIYADRPSTCRFMGLPLVDADGTVVHPEWCGKNFTSVDPRPLPGMPFGYSSWEEDVEALTLSSSPRYTFLACAILSASDSSPSP